MLVRETISFFFPASSHRKRSFFQQQAAPQCSEELANGEQATY